MSEAQARQIDLEEHNRKNRSNYKKKLEEYKTNLYFKEKKRKNQPSYNQRTKLKNQQIDLIKNRLQVLSNKGWFNKFYQGQKNIDW